jgi:hypothetical protein
MDGPRLELQISKSILLDALGPGNWLGAQSEEKNRARMVALYKVESEEKTYRCTVCPQAETDQDRAVNARTKRVALHRSHERLGTDRWKSHAVDGAVPATPSSSAY